MVQSNKSSILLKASYTDALWLRDSLYKVGGWDSQLVGMETVLEILPLPLKSFTPGSRPGKLTFMDCLSGLFAFWFPVGFSQ